MTLNQFVFDGVLFAFLIKTIAGWPSSHMRRRGNIPFVTQLSHKV